MSARRRPAGFAVGRGVLLGVVRLLLLLGLPVGAVAGFGTAGDATTPSVPSVDATPTPDATPSAGGSAPVAGGTDPSVTGPHAHMFVRVGHHVRICP